MTSKANSTWYKVQETDGRLWIDNGRVGVEFRRGDGGRGDSSGARLGATESFTPTHVVDLASGAVFALRDGPSDPWWELEWRDRAGFKAMATSSSRATYSVTHSVSGDEELRVVMRWENLSLRLARYGAAHVADKRDPGGDPDFIDVEVTLTLRRGDPLTSWDIRIANRSDRYTLWKVTFIRIPNLAVVGADSADDFLTVPTDYGWDIPNPKQRSLWLNATYPSNQAVMQFMAFRNARRGLYLAWHDPTASPKSVQIRSTPDGRLSLTFLQNPEHMTRVQRQVAVEGLVLGVFAGDWYDAACIYREWALKQWWAREGLVAHRPDIPHWFKENVLWWTLSSGKDTGSLSTEREYLVEEIGELAMRLHERFPYPTVVHWYNWHPIPFNTSFPDYLPAKDGFADQVARLHANGIRVMPYVNARLVDPNSDAWQKEGAGEFCARKASPRLEPHDYPITYELYPNEQHVVPMCSATEYWQNKVTGIVRSLRHDVGIQVIYLDQIAAAVPPLCFDPRHGHPPGGGDYAVQGYDKLLHMVREAAWTEAGPMAITTESNAEPFIAGAPAFLMCVPSPPYEIPLFKVVYSGYVITFGRPYYDPDLEHPEAFATKLAQTFTWGTQLGWIRNSIAMKLLTPEHAREAAFVDTVCRAFASGRKYLVEGYMLRPPVPLSSMATIKTVWYGHDREIPAVMASAWQALDHTTALAVANVTDDPVLARYRLDGAGYAAELNVGSGSLDDLSGQGVTGLVDCSGEAPVVEVLVPARTAAVVRLPEGR